MLVDTNVLLRFDDTDSPDHPICAAAVDQMLIEGTELCICAQVMIEYWAVATRPIVSNGLGMDTADVSHNLYDAQATFVFLPEPVDIGIRWLDLVTANRVIGKQVHDARIVAFMLAYGITHLITLNPSDFARYSGITVATPSEILATNS